MITNRFFVRTRTGQYTHLARAGFSSTECGVWLRTPAERMAVNVAQVRPERVCENCAHPTQVAVAVSITRFFHGAA